MADSRNRSDGANPPGQSIFDLFEPPPESDPNSFGKIPVVRENGEDSGNVPVFDPERSAANDAEAAGLAHWTAPPTGQVPAVFGPDDGEKKIKGPSWHGDDPSWAGDDISDVFADEAGVNARTNRDHHSSSVTRVPREPGPGLSLGGVDTPVDAGPSHIPASSPAPPSVQTRQAAPSPPQVTNRPAAAHPPAVVERGSVPIPPRVKDQPSPRRSGILGDSGVPSGQVPVARSTPPVQLPTDRSPSGPMPGGAAPAPPSLSPMAKTRPPRTVRPDTGQQAPSAQPERTTVDRMDPMNGGAAPYEASFDEPVDRVDDGLPKGGDRDLVKAIAAGAVLVAVLGLALFLGPVATLLLVTALAVLAVLELCNAMRVAGLRPATLLALAATASLPLAAYFRGQAGYPLVLSMLVIFGFVWYLAGVDSERPVLNLSLTIMTVAWVGGLGGFAALMARENMGLELLASTIVIAVASDTMAYVGGKAFGTHPFHPISPNKTWEGTLVGLGGAVFASVAIGLLPFGDLFASNLKGALFLGFVVGVVTPIGDLSESLVKRDLGIKDMGTIIPGHGGVLDRLDGLLFALPAAYYFAQIYGLIGI